jgi:NhaP-type Na+/H+ and K+/H+ antiporter
LSAGPSTSCKTGILTLVVTLAFAWGAVTQAIGLEALFGAFVAGILFGQMPRLPEEVIHKLESVTLAVFAPIFFAVAGLKVNLTSLFELSLIGWALLIIAVAMFGKIVGAYTGARLLGGRDHWTGLAYGAALNARGALGIIIATIGLNQGVLAQEMFSIIVIMAITTSLLAPPALRAILKNVQPEPAELRRLRQEELDAGSLVANIHRVLLPLRIRQQDDRIGAELGLKSNTCSPTESKPDSCMVGNVQSWTRPGSAGLRPLTDYLVRMSPWSDGRLKSHSRH